MDVAEQEWKEGCTKTWSGSKGEGGYLKGHGAP